ncbi:DUF7281 domain-containing protein [Paraglaciecola marina]|uniref:DUF7281 domain-containing protein n=1 Tax=Paraglaciecola marina TaxID=2500157 RepID=UPI00105B9B9E|nr:hypothetical protein [Paraglaciecola marina]
MAASLTPKAKALLLEQNTKLKFDDRAATTAVAAVKEILIWCDNEDIVPGKWLVKGKKYRFNRQGIDKIQEAYQSAMSENIFDDFSQDDHQTASTKSTNEKQGKLKPTAHLILAAVIKGASYDGFHREFYPCHQVNIELNINEIKLSRYDALIMVENRDSFNDWYRFQAQITHNFGKVLVIYRGDSDYSEAASSFLKLWRVHGPNKPVVYFGDFDLSGLRLAVSAKCSHLLLPSYEFLRNNVISHHYPDEQQKYLVGLERDCAQGWQALLSLMYTQRAGLRQQRMYNTAFVFYNC